MMRLTETGLVDAIAATAPWLTPIPTAILVARAVQVHLGWSLVEAAVAALIIETVGLTSMATALTFREWNRTKRKPDPLAPTWIPTTLACIYFMAVIGLTITLDTFPILVRFAPVVFPLLSLVGFANIALRSDHRRRMAAVAADKDARRERRLAARAARSTSQAAYVCADCGRTFAKQQSLAAHVRRCPARSAVSSS